MKYLAEILLLLGLVAVIAGVELVFSPAAALLAFGLSLVLVALLLDRARR